MPKTTQTQKQVAPKVTTPTAVKSEVAPTAKPAVPVAKTQDTKALTFNQWQQCKSKAIAADVKLLWNVKILEAIPTGGTYAKGSLNGDVAFPVRVVIKTDSQLKDKILSMLVVGKNAYLRGNCTEIAADGAVVLQAF